MKAALRILILLLLFSACSKPRGAIRKITTFDNGRLASVTEFDTLGRKVFERFSFFAGEPGSRLITTISLFEYDKQGRLSLEVFVHSAGDLTQNWFRFNKDGSKDEFFRSYELPDDFEISQLHGLTNLKQATLLQELKIPSQLKHPEEQVYNFLPLRQFSREASQNGFLIKETWQTQGYGREKWVKKVYDQSGSLVRIERQPDRGYPTDVVDQTVDTAGNVVREAERGTNQYSIYEYDSRNRRIGESAFHGDKLAFLYSWRYADSLKTRQTCTKITSSAHFKHWPKKIVTLFAYEFYDR